MKLKFCLAVLFGLITWAAPIHPGHAGGPAAQVQSMLEEVMSVQTDLRLQGPEFRDQRRDAIKKFIAQNFHFSAMAKQALGSSWEKLHEAERAEKLDYAHIPGSRACMTRCRRC